MTDNLISELARLGVATVYEAGGRTGLIDLDLHQIVPGSRVAGPARTVRCGQDDNLMVHAVMAAAQPGDVLVLTMPEPAPVALVGELLATQARARGVAAILVDAAVRDVEELRALGLPIWARWVRVRGAAKTIPGELQVPIAVGGATIRPGDVIVLDADGAVVVAASRAEAVLEASLAREARETGLRAAFAAGQLSIDAYNLRDAVRAQLAPAGQDERSTP
jgi:4-hydroxy-4-methyl-2-oxoglutarate aldolase